LLLQIATDRLDKLSYISPRRLQHISRSVCTTRTVQTPRTDRLLLRPR
jgi:hypothetical protein